MTSILQYLADLDEIFEKNKELTKHLISPTKDFFYEVKHWKDRFIREYGKEERRRK